MTKQKNSRRVSIVLTILALTVCAVAVVHGEERPRSVAEIRIEMPSGSDGFVAVEPGRRSVTLELPRGSVFPLDFSGSTGGLLRGGEVTIVSDDRVRLQLDLAHGLLDRVNYEPNAVTLRFTSRLIGSESDVDEDAYHLGVADKIQITVHNQPEMSSLTVVGEDGTVVMPILGEVEVAGQTPRQLAERLTELLGRDYLVDPQVDVLVEDFRSQWVMVTGQIHNPGRYPLQGGTRLKEVLSMAGGFAERAGEKIVVSRTDQETGAVESFTIQRMEFEAGSDNLVLQSGDIIEIHDPAYAYISGEVRSPSRVPVERGLTLLQALTQVGGLSEWADKKNITILYPAGIVPRERVVNLRKIENGQAEDPILVGEEKIIVKRRFF
ncbi:MAG: SLBB domain-containing protein [Acidobacteriota bacterium]|nr:SLBB domain-containing protein [Acidobacteriota bacterium]MDH3784075.1 SLBB domain-containing protein [Acidobacteriota bacterium]